MSEAFERLTDIRTVRHALLLGLESFGEVERVIDAFDSRAMYDKQSPAKELRPLHPTGSPDTVGRFAAALRVLDMMESELEPAHV